MKHKVIEFFQNLPKEKSEQFNKAFELYRQSDGKSLGAERVINATGYSDQGLENLKYDLQKLHGIKDIEMLQVPVIKEDISSENTETNEGKNEDSEGVTVEGKEGTRPDNADPGEAIVNAAQNTVSIREEFPFLNDADCPNELKILVADKLTAWNRYKDCHAQLQKMEDGTVVATNEEMAIVANEASKAFDENQKIYEELNAYKATGNILGAHPIFKKLALQREVDEMTPDQLIKFKNSSSKYFSVNKKDLAEAKTAKDTAKIEAIKKRVKERGEKLVLVNKKLGVK
jgi:hypothetical protein